MDNKRSLFAPRCGITEKASILLVLRAPAGGSVPADPLGVTACQKRARAASDDYDNCSSGQRLRKHRLSLLKILPIYLFSPSCVRLDYDYDDHGEELPVAPSLSFPVVHLDAPPCPFIQALHHLRFDSRFFFPIRRFSSRISKTTRVPFSTASPTATRVLPLALPWASQQVGVTMTFTKCE